MPLDIPNPPQSADLIAEAEPMLALAKVYEIDSPQMYTAAGDELKAIRAKRKDLEHRRKSITGPLDKAKKSVMDLFRKPDTILAEAEDMLRAAMLAYDREQREKAEAERRAAEAAAEAERKRLAAAAEAAEAERKRRAEAAAEAEKKGDAAAAEAERNAAAEAERNAEAATAATHTMTAAEVPDRAPPKVSGIATAHRWTATITDKQAFLRHVAETGQFLDDIEIKTGALTKMAAALKNEMTIPGVTAESKATLRVGS